MSYCWKIVVLRVVPRKCHYAPALHQRDLPRCVNSTPNSVAARAWEREMALWSRAGEFQGLTLPTPVM
ncbi:hypothetical protein GUJ93_ZPchr0002g26807 [Zizania palustris]|uniref:Uncharacterized protein n=1 Tax=Zizania palustris TaxID=103762 RepID=A0A8J5ST42_ZIZPA|nr:hypothetical protein GUJ93_ZPchr0002g26807 [Zizania palustris]